MKILYDQKRGVICVKIKAEIYNFTNKIDTTTETPMGKVTTTLAIVDLIDRADAEPEMIPIEQIRSVTLENVLVDTDATTLCLPKGVIARLGWRILKVVLETARGIKTEPSTVNCQLFKIL